MVKLYSDQISGNCYKLRLLLTQLGVPFQVVETSVVQGQQRTDAFRAKNPNAKVPIVELEDGTILAESNAILFHFAQDSPLWPAEPLERSRALQWMFFEQYTHEPKIAVARFWVKFRDLTAEDEIELAKLQKAGHHALKVMEGHLVDHEFFAAGRYTIADIALYAYTHMAHEGGFDLEGYPAVRRWLDRVAAQPGHIPIDHVC